ncbi:Transcription factor bHLH90 [Neolecta irregularis DAH-3]|uniref:Transcription factor bHLH90 n=1 Tax=Neolecta irregularis (strain DAH-3) TaxID=1198029 RepID=A0A1U7LWR3_NEOID|nr:Transcription factor bHLH90 [Neolecta irregularis DAH-3]|eukprot:OLL27116.1 Transcription factor bHLH90 [Neolecta irregularis DAH-3]
MLSTPQSVASPMEISTSSPPSTKRQRYLSSSSKTKKKTLLTAEERQANHTASEQQRRQKIRDASIRLCQVVPSLTEDVCRSEARVLKSAREHIEELLQEKQRLLEEMDRRNMET